MRITLSLYGLLILLSGCEVGLDDLTLTESGIVFDGLIADGYRACFTLYELRDSDAQPSGEQARGGRIDIFEEGVALETILYKPDTISRGFRDDSTSWPRTADIDEQECYCTTGKLRLRAGFNYTVKVTAQNGDVFSSEAVEYRDRFTLDSVRTVDFDPQIGDSYSTRGLQHYGRSNSADIRQGIFTGGNTLAHGLETYIAKNTGRLTGSLAYTRSVTRTRYAEINGGDYFRGDFDRPNDLSIQLNYASRNDKYDFSFGWTYQSGVPATFPVGQSNDGRYIFTAYNQARLPTYHRADLSVRKSWRGKRNPSIRRALNLTVYNLYNRENPQVVEFRRETVLRPDPVTGVEVESIRNVPVSRQLFGIIPGITYQTKF